jgi:hypothetical protein
MISDGFNVSEILPDERRDAAEATETFKLSFVFENYCARLRFECPFRSGQRELVEFQSRRTSETT